MTAWETLVLGAAPWYAQGVMVRRHLHGAPMFRVRQWDCVCLWAGVWVLRAGWITVFDSLMLLLRLEVFPETMVSRDAPHKKGVLVSIGFDQSQALPVLGLSRQGQQTWREGVLLSITLGPPLPGVSHCPCPSCLGCPPCWSSHSSPCHLLTLASPAPGLRLENTLSHPAGTAPCPES